VSAGKAIGEQPECTGLAVPEAAFDDFLARLENPTPPNASLRQLMRAPWNAKPPRET